MAKLSTINKICLAGIFIVLAMICQKVVAVNYISAIPFLRISFGGPAIIIFSSIFLGPWYGLVVGFGSDIFGYFIFDPKNNAFFPQITAIYALLGFASYFVFLFSKKIFKERLMKIIFPVFIAITLASVISIICLAPKLNLYGGTYVLAMWQKIVISVSLFTLSVLLFGFVYIFDKKKKSNIDVYRTAFSLLIIEILIMVMFGTLMKGLAFGFATYPVILLCQIIVLFVNVPLNTIIISFLSDILKRRNYSIDTL